MEFNNGVVKILTDGQTATSDGNLYAFDDTHYEAYVVIDDSPVQGYAFGDGKELEKRINNVLFTKTSLFLVFDQTIDTSLNYFLGKCNLTSTGKNIFALYLFTT